MSRIKSESKCGLPQPETNKQTKEVKELLDLAKITNDESAFQQKHHYKKFKDKYNVDMVVCVQTLMIGLKKIRFSNETVFWCQKIIEDSRFCDEQIRLLAFQSMTESFYYLEKYEKVVEYGKKCLDHHSTENLALLHKLLLLHQMKFASVKLNMTQEAMKYAREVLKVNVALYNANNVEKFDLLLSYYDLIDLQIQLGDSKSAKRIFEKHLKLFNLNSMNLNDVLLALNEEGYEKVLPIGGEQKKYQEEFENNFLLSKESNNHWGKMVKLFYYVGKICWQKHIVYFGDKSHGHVCPCTINLTWGNLSLKVYVDIVNNLLHLTKLNMECKKRLGIIDGGISIADYCPLVLDTISTTLLLADQDHLNRENLFSTLFIQIRFLMTNMQACNMKNVSFYVAAVQRANDKINLKKVMPFIQFCLKSLDEGANSLENVNLKLQFVMLKNSLTIMNHFKSNGRKEEY